METVWTFGYGSNMGRTSLRAKGIHPTFSAPAVLHGFRRTFDVRNAFRIEGGAANVHAGVDADVVHGVLHELSPDDARRLDALEGTGLVYAREERTVHPYAGGTVRAALYRGIDTYLDPALRPSRRYLDVLVAGAREMGVAADAIAELERVPLHPDPDPGAFVWPEPCQAIEAGALAANPELIAFAGAVFDMTGGLEEFAFLKQLFGGRDVTRTILQRLATEENDAARADAERRLVEVYLNEMARVFRFAGRLVPG